MVKSVSLDNLSEFKDKSDALYSVKTETISSLGCEGDTIGVVYADETTNTITIETVGKLGNKETYCYVNSDEHLVLPSGIEIW